MMFNKDVGMIDYQQSAIKTIIDSLESMNPNIGIQIKFDNDGFVLYYIVADVIDYKGSPKYKQCFEQGYEILDDTEKILKKKYKESVGETLKIKQESESESFEALSPALSRYYIRIFRKYIVS